MCVCTSRASALHSATPCFDKAVLAQGGGGVQSLLRFGQNQQLLSWQLAASIHFTKTHQTTSE